MAVIKVHNYEMQNLSLFSPFQASMKSSAKNWICEKKSDCIASLLLTLRLVLPKARNRLLLITLHVLVDVTAFSRDPNKDLLCIF